MQYRLRTLLIVLALGPPVLAGCFGPIHYQPPPARVRVRPTLIGTWKTEDDGPAATLTFSANADLVVRDDAGRTLRTFSYRQTDDDIIALEIDDPDFQFSGVMLLEPGRDDDHLVLSLPRADAPDQQDAKSDRMFDKSRMALKRVK